MKRFFCISLLLIVSVATTGCLYDMFGHETYTDIGDYATAFDLSEIRFTEAREEMFPQNVSTLDVESFYFEWELGPIGSADVETLLSVKYDANSFSEEISRLQLLADGNAKYDKERFSLPAYITVLGESNTSIYALVDADNLVIHYIHLQLLDEERIDIPKEFLPDGYFGFGEVSGTSFDAYSTKEGAVKKVPSKKQAVPKGTACKIFIEKRLEQWKIQPFSVII